MAELKLLIADEDRSFCNMVKSAAIPQGFQVQTCGDTQRALELITTWAPHYVAANLTLSKGGGAYQLLQSLRSDKNLRHQITHLVVLSEHNHIDNVKEAIRRGAVDYVVKPCAPVDLVRRLIFHARPKKELLDLKEPSESSEQANIMLHLVNLIMAQALTQQPLVDKFHQLTRMLSMKMKGVRCSIVRCDSLWEGLVIASHDNPRAFGIRLDMQTYPEFLHVMQSGRLIAVENLANSPEFAPVYQKSKEISFNSLIVCPLFNGKSFFGVLSLRLPESRLVILDYEIRFVEIVSQVISLVLEGSRQELKTISQSLSDANSSKPTSTLNKKLLDSTQSGQVLPFKAVRENK